MFVLKALIVSVTAFASPLNCEPDALIKIGNREVYQWDFVATGIDLAKLEKLNLTAGPAVPVGVLDSGIDLGALPEDRIDNKLLKTAQSKNGILGNEPIHGTEVASLILRPDVGVGGSAKLVALADADKSKDFFAKGWSPADTEFYQYRNADDGPFRRRRDFSEAIKIMRSAKPKLVNLSQETGSWKKTEEDFRNLDFILITSAGNDFYLSNSLVGPVKSRLKAVVVGCFTLDGVRSGNSGPAVDILAPQDTPSYSDKTGDERNGSEFGHTSGATALVSSALIPVIARLPEIDLETTEKLLKMTGIPTPDSAGGVPFLNVYRLLRVTARIEDRLKIKKLKGSPKNIRNLLESESGLIDFESETKKALEQASALKNNDDCNSFYERGRLLRKAFFLNPTAANQREIVSFYKLIPKILSERPATNVLEPAKLQKVFEGFLDGPPHASGPATSRIAN